VKENLMMKKQLQSLEDFNTASENRKFYKLFSLNNKCEPKLNVRKGNQVNTIIAGGIEVTYC
jgi:hypothetical protein